MLILFLVVCCYLYLFGIWLGVFVLWLEASCDLVHPLFTLLAPPDVGVFRLAHCRKAINSAGNELLFWLSYWNQMLHFPFLSSCSPWGSLTPALKSWRAHTQKWFLWGNKYISSYLFSSFTDFLVIHWLIYLRDFLYLH